MKHIAALLIKFIIVAVVLEIVLGYLTDLAFNEILYVTFAVTVAAYVLGDLMILAISNNTVATIVDISLALFVTYMFNYVYGVGRIQISDAFVSAIVIGAGEWFFHKYVVKYVFPDREEA